MGQYHKVVSMDAAEYLSPHALGTGLKEWEQTAGAYPSALAFLLAHNPGNMPADVGHHPMAGRWAGHRVLSIGDYAERGDIRRFQGPPLNRLYSLCSEAPIWEEFANEPPTVYYVQGGSRSSDLRWLDPSKGKITRHVETAERRFNAAVRETKRLTVNGRYELFTNLSPKLIGAVEYVNSVRFVGNGWLEEVPVKPYAERGADGHLHYRITDAIANNLDQFNMVCRLAGIAGWRESNQLNPHAATRPDGERWPWDRPPADLSWHDATDADQDVGQHRVWVNLERREYIDPGAFGEVPTTLGIMRASSWENGPLGSSAAAVLAMLHHPSSRGGGDIDQSTLAVKGQWRNCHLALTAEHSNDAAIPTTAEAKATFLNISDNVLKAVARAVELDRAEAAD